MSLQVIVVDDSKVMRQIVKRTLRQAGYDDWEVAEAENGAEAFDLAMRTKPDLVLSDWNMPQMSGIDLLRKLNASGADIPLGFVTSEGSPQMRELAEAEGALFLIAKPFTPEVLRDTLEEFLE